jgi:uncharacterized protein (TIGR02145 family)
LQADALSREDASTVLTNRSDRIFLCHASEDGSRVEVLHQRLKSAGLNPWLDKKDLPPARDWDAEITKALGAVRLVIVCLSTHLISKSGYARREIDMALETLRQLPPGSTFVIPVRLEECAVPASLGGLTRFDLLDDADVDQLAEHIKTLLGLFTDARDGQIYKTIHVGTQIWLAANLNHAVADSWWYDDDPLNGRRYGRLYTWEAARRACPDGWHVAADSEWRELARHSGGYRDMDEGYPGTGSKLGRPQTAFESLIAGGESGFAAGLGGYRRSDGELRDLGKTGLYWTSTEYQYNDLGNFQPIYHRDIKTAWMYSFYIMSGVPELRRDYQLPLRPDVYPRGCGLSVRCVKNS